MQSHSEESIVPGAHERLTKPPANRETVARRESTRPRIKNEIARGVKSRCSSTVRFIFSCASRRAAIDSRACCRGRSPSKPPAILSGARKLPASGACVEPSRLSSIATLAHRAPAAALGATVVVEQPSARVAAARLQPMRLSPSYQIRGRPHDGPQHRVQSRCCRCHPIDLSMPPHDVASRRRGCVQQRHIRRPGRTAFFPCKQDPVHRLS